MRRRRRRRVLYKSVMYIKCTQEDSIHISERFAFIRRPTKEQEQKDGNANRDGILRRPEAATCEKFRKRVHCL